MGHCFSGQLDRPRIISNFLIETHPTKFYSENSTLQLEIKSWPQEHLPNLRCTYQLKTQIHSFKNQGQILFNSKTNQIFYQNPNSQNPETIPLSHDQKANPKSILQLKIQKNSKGFKIQFENQPGYELLMKQKQLKLGSTFYTYGHEYEMTSFVDDKKIYRKSLEEGQGSQISTDLSNSLKKSVSFENEKNVEINPNQKPSCRICLGSQVTNENPMVSPCDCSGSVKFSHLNCWKKWIVSIEEGKKHFRRWSITREKCEVCHKDLLNDRKYRQKLIQILQPNLKVSAPYIVFEAVEGKSNCLLKKKNIEKMSVILISFMEKKKFSIGTSVGVEIPLSSDIGEGRRNAEIEFQSGKVKLRDTMTKYGTYIKVERPVVIRDDVQRCFLYKNSLLCFKVQ